MTDWKLGCDKSFLCRHLLELQFTLLKNEKREFHLVRELKLLASKMFIVLLALYFEFYNHF